MPIGHKHLSSQSQIITSGLHLDEPSFICPQDTFLFTFRAEVFPSNGNIQWRLYYWGTKWTVDKLPTQSLARVRPCLAPQHDIEQCLFCRRRFDWRKPLAKLKLDAPSPESEADTWERPCKFTHSWWVYKFWVIGPTIGDLSLLQNLQCCILYCCATDIHFPPPPVTKIGYIKRPHHHLHNLTRLRATLLLVPDRAPGG